MTLDHLSGAHPPTAPVPTLYTWILPHTRRQTPETPPMLRTPVALALVLGSLATPGASAPLSAPAPLQQGPIHMHFDMHVDPFPQTPLPQKRLVYAGRVDNMEWVLDQMEPLSVKISFLAGGEFGELLVDEGAGGDGAAVLQRLYDAGGQIGSHSHSEWRTGNFNWPSVPNNPTLAQSRQSWQDNIDWVNAAINLAYGGSPPEPLSTINACKGAHLPQSEADYHTLMTEFGFEVREPGPEEDYYGWYDHYIWHPFRPSPANYMAEDLSAPFVQVTQGMVIGKAGAHHGVMQDMTAPSVKRQFLQLYINWRFNDRTGADEKVWCWGWGSHAKDFDPSDSSRAALVDVVGWLDEHFVDRVEPSGSDTMKWSTHQETRDAYLQWETDNPGTSSFSFDSLTVDWNEYPWLRPVAEEMSTFDWVADLDLGSNVEAYHLSDGTNDAVIAWTDSGSAVVDLSAYVGPSLRVVGLETGTLYSENNATEVDVGAEPIIATERNATCPSPQNYCVLVPNSSGSPAVIGWSGGQPSVSQNNFVLEVADAAPLRAGIFYYGPQQIQVPFGNGVRCVGGSLFRLPVVITDNSGAASHAMDFTNPPQAAGQILPGSIWQFQFWFRDTLAGGAEFNLSDGLEVQFCP